MKIGILSRNFRLYSTQRLLEAAKERGHQVSIIDPLRCYMTIHSEKSLIHFKDRTLCDYEAIIPRIGASITFYGTAVVRQFEMINIYTANSSLSISRARDKLRSLQLLAQKKISLPITSFAHSTKETTKILDLVGGAPLIIKLLEGTQGKGVVYAETKKAAESVIDAFREMDAHFLVQKFIKESKGSDIRCFVIGNKVVASMMREAKEGEFRSNLHRGGIAKAVKITPEENDLALKAAKAMGLNIAGVDLLRSNHGPLIIEVNSSPGLEGIEKSTNINIAREIIKYIELNYLKSKTLKIKKNVIPA
jgi:ribosomal protein S6--L-glutamate ligase